MSSVDTGDGALLPEKLQEALISEVAKEKDEGETVLSDTELKVIAHAVKIWGSLSEKGRASKYDMIKNRVFEEIGSDPEKKMWNLEEVTKQTTSAVQDVYKKTVNKSKIDQLKSDIEGAFLSLKQIMARLNPSQHKSEIKKELELWQDSGKKLGDYLFDRTSQLNDSKVEKEKEKTSVDERLPDLCRLSR